MILRDYDDVRLSEFFTPLVMNQVTNFRTFEAFLRASGFDARTAEEFDALPCVEERDKFVAENSQFSSWLQMKNYARDVYFGMA